MNAKRHLLLKMLYGAATLAALFTGFGNMPLWGRYYVADLPGLAWSGDFFINVNVHILSGSLLLCIATYVFTATMMGGRLPTSRMTLSGRIRAFLLAVALATGILMVVKNLPGIHFPMTALIAFNFAHMTAALLIMIAGLLALIFRLPWRQIR